MASKKHAKPVLQIRNFFWMTLVLLLVSLIWRRLLGFLTFVEGLKIPGQYIDAAAYITLITSNMPVDWHTETFVLLGQVAGLACLLHVGPPGPGEQPGKGRWKPGIFPWPRKSSGRADQERGEPEETQKRYGDHIHADQLHRPVHSQGEVPS